jgi:hypothetical protein
MSAGDIHTPLYNHSTREKLRFSKAVGQRPEG